MIQKFGNVEVTVRDEPTYSVSSSDNVRSYKNEYRHSTEYKHTCGHGITTKQDGVVVSTAVVLGVGGATGVHEHTLAHDGLNLFVAAGDGVFSLSLPNLQLNWQLKVDFAACFGVYWIKHLGCLLTWGELNISCYSQDGKELWSTSRPDIFTEGLKLSDGHAIVTDFNGDTFAINLATGKIEQ